MRPNSAKLAIIPGILRVYLGNPGYTWKIPGILPISPIFVRFCLRSRGKSYHNLIVLAVECLIVLGGYTSKQIWPSLDTAGVDRSSDRGDRGRWVWGAAHLDLLSKPRGSELSLLPNQSYTLPASALPLSFPIPHTHRAHGGAVTVTSQVLAALLSVNPTRGPWR